jgi:molecular chaperone GrpE
MAETHHDRTKAPPRAEPGGASGHGQAEGEGDSQIRQSPPNVDRTEPPAEEILDGAPEKADDGGGGARAREDDAIVRLEKEVASLNDRLLRTAAEFDNYRKRTDRERAELPLRARAEVVSPLLDIMDDLERVAAYDDDTSAHALLEGIRLVDKKLSRLVHGWGLEVVDPTGQSFDPATMEAMMTVPAEHPEEDEVVADVFQKGYRLGDSLIRPARVRVKKYEG